jgi:hypothetical protein
MVASLCSRSTDAVTPKRYTQPAPQGWAPLAPPPQALVAVHPRGIAKRETREGDLTGTHLRVGHPPECKGPAARRSTRHSKTATRPRAKRRPTRLHPAGRQSTEHAREAGLAVLQRGYCGLCRFRPLWGSLAYGRSTWILSRSACRFTKETGQEACPTGGVILAFTPVAPISTALRIL